MNEVRFPKDFLWGADVYKRQPQVRAGSSLTVRLPEAGVSGVMAVKSAQHTFRAGEHRMDLTLKGGTIT